MTSIANVSIAVDGAGRGQVTVDGVRIPRIQGVTACVTAGEPTSIGLSLAIAGVAQLEFSGANFSIDGVVMPASAELALWAYLKSKYCREVNVTVLESTSLETAIDNT